MKREGVGPNDHKLNVIGVEQREQFFEVFVGFHQPGFSENPPLQCALVLNGSASSGGCVLRPRCPILCPLWTTFRLIFIVPKGYFLSCAMIVHPARKQQDSRN